MTWTEFCSEFEELMATLQVRIPENERNSVVDRYWRHLQSWSDDDLRNAMDSLIGSNRRQGVLPPVLEFKTALRAIKAASGDRYVSAIPNDKLATSTEITGMARCIQAILSCHRLNVEVNGIKLGAIRKSCRPMDLEEWISEDKPQTWSPLLDTLYESSYKLYRHCLSHGGPDYGRFLNQYADILEDAIQEAEKKGAERRWSAFAEKAPHNGDKRTRRPVMDDIL